MSSHTETGPPSAELSDSGLFATLEEVALIENINYLDTFEKVIKKKDCHF